MHPFALKNGQYQQIGPLHQASQAAPHSPHDATRALSANNSYQYMTVNSAVQPSQSAIFALQNESYVSRQMAAQNMMKNIVEIRNPLLKRLLIEPQELFNSQSQNSSLPDSHGSQAPTQQNFYQYSTNQSSSNATNPNTTYPRQDMTVPWTQSVAVNERRTVKALDVSHLQQYRASQSLCQNSNNATTRPLSSYVAAASSPPQEQMVNPNTLMSAGSLNVSQILPNRCGQNSTEGRFASTYQSSWGMVTSQPFGNSSVASQTFSNGQVLYVLNTSQKTQQPATHPCSSHNDWGEPANSRSTNMMNQRNSNFPLVKTNEVSLNPADGSQQMLRHHVSADSLSNFCTVSSDQYPPPYDSQHFISVPKTSKQNMHPITSARSESYNFNATPPVSLHSGQSLPQSVMSTGPLTLNPPPQHKTLPKSFCINSKRDKRKQKMATNPPPNNSMISKECPVVLPSLCSPVKQNDNASHSALGHTSTRAVAVVPPLSQEKGNTFSNVATFESVDPAGKKCITPDLSKGTEACLREESDLNQKTSNPIEASKVASNHGAVLTTLDSESPRSPESPAHKPSEVPASQTCSKEQNKTATPESPPVLELSSLPTNSWTAEALNKLILETDQAQPKRQDSSDPKITVKLLIMFWNKSIKALLQYIKARKLGFTLDFENLCIDISDKSVILTEVKPDFKDHLKHYHVLVDGEVYSEQPYESLWLNVNHQLDDIDKEFGFPWSLKQHQYVHETDGQIDPLQTESSIPEPIVNEVVSQTESETVDRVEEKVSTVECTPPSPASQNESEDSSSTSDHSLKIEVLPPEAAKFIYEQVQQRTDQTDCENAKVPSGSLQMEMNKEANSTLKISSVESKSDDKIKEICCLAKFMEMYSISDLPFSKCMCKVEQNYNGQTVKTPKPDPDSSAKSGEVTDCQTITLSASELCSKLEQIIDLTDEDDQLDPSSQETEVDQDQETEIISQISTGSLLSTVTKSENKDNVSTIDFVIASSPFTLEISETESEDNCPPKELQSTGSIPSNTFVSSAKQTESDQFCTSEAEHVLQLPDQGGKCEQAHLKLTEDAESPLESKQQTQMTFYSHSVMNKPIEKKPRQSSLDRFFPNLKTSKFKRHNGLDLMDIPEAQPKSSEVKTVELVLFGSGQGEQGLVSENERTKPPKILSVNLDTSRRKPLQADCPKKYSAKHLIYERWRNTFPPTPNGSIIKGFRNKLKRQKCLSASLPSPSSTNQWSASSEVQVPDGLSKNRLSLKRRRSFPLLRRHEKVKRRRYSVTLEQPSNQEEEAQKGDLDARLLKENIVLKFSVLPNTFHFKEGSSRMKERSDSGLDMPQLEDENQSLRKTVEKSKVGSWCPTTEKQNKLLCAPQTVSLFHEYQKKYKEKTQMSTDESSDK